MTKMVSWSEFSRGWASPRIPGLGGTDQGLFPGPNPEQSTSPGPWIREVVQGCTSPGTGGNATLGPADFRNPRLLSTDCFEPFLFSTFLGKADGG